jgi:hypothetical protein
MVEMYLIFGWVFSFVFGYCLLYRWQISLPGKTQTGLNISINNTQIQNLLTPVSWKSHTSDGNGVSDGSHAEEEEEPELVHIVHSRFMQHQPFLIQLGLARLKLLEDFFMQSLQQQTSLNFLCVIRTDPDLDLTLRRPLLDLLEKLNVSYLVIAGNDSPHFQYLDIIKHQQSLTGSSNIIGGDFEAAHKYLGKSRNVLETRLDVDDGLNRYFAEDIQSLAMDHFDAFHNNKTDSAWKIWCAASYMEWQFHSPKMRESMDRRTKPHDSGSLFSLRSNICITAGLTVAYVAPKQTVDMQKLDFPSTNKHSTLHRTIPKCDWKRAHCAGCFDFFNLFPTALRARTPSSAGMQNVLWPSLQNDTSSSTTAGQRRYRKAAAKQEAAQAKFWNATDYFFDFDEPMARKIHAYLETHMRQIAQDNLEGQCTHGHSCKNGSRLLLQSIVQDYS